MGGSTTAALQCLRNDEIMSHILAFTPSTDTWNDCKENQAVLNIALVCRAFREPALNELWRSLESFLPLLRLLSAPGQAGLISGTYVLAGPITQHRWDRFDDYARRVRELSLSASPAAYLIESIRPAVDPSVYLRIAREHAGPILPRLRELYCFPLRPESVIFLSSSLHTIGFQGLSASLTCTFLAALPSEAANVKNLRVESTGPSSFHPLVGSCVTQLRALDELYLDLKNAPLSEYARMHNILATLGLQSFSVAASDHWEDEIPDYNFQSGFSELQSLGIEGGFRFISSTISSILSRDLSKITVNCAYSHDALVSEGTSGWKPLINVIFPREWDSLTHISLDLHHSTTATDNINILLSAIKHLRLRIFSLMRYAPMCISDADIDKFARGCPLAEQVTFTSGEQDANTAPSLACLTSLARHCSALQVVQLSLNIPDNLTRSTSPDLYNNNVRFFFPSFVILEQLSAEKILGIARYLDQLLPRLERVVSWEMPGAVYCRKIETLVRQLQAARAEVKFWSVPDIRVADDWTKNIRKTTVVNEKEFYSSLELRLSKSRTAH